MSPARKILIGALATIAMSYGWHAAAAQIFIDSLLAKAAAKVADAPGVDVHKSGGWLDRDIVLSGPVSDIQTRDRLVAQVEAITGVGRAKWSFDAEMPAESGR